MNFTRIEMRCRCGKCGFDAMDLELIGVLEDVRKHFGKPVIITSGNRCPDHNEKIGGVNHSYHTRGKAADFYVRDVAAAVVADYLEKKYSHRYGVGRYVGRIHIDMRSYPVRWDKR